MQEHCSQNEEDSGDRADAPLRTDAHAAAWHLETHLTRRLIDPVEKNDSELVCIRGQKRFQSRQPLLQILNLHILLFQFVFQLSV